MKQIIHLKCDEERRFNTSNICATINFVVLMDTVTFILILNKWV